MKSVLELELELSQAKLSRMTSTVKQLGTKLKNANEKAHNLGHELAWYKDQNEQLNEFKSLIRKTAMTKEEAHSQEISIPPCKHNF